MVLTSLSRVITQSFRSNSIDSANEHLPWIIFERYPPNNSAVPQIKVESSGGNKSSSCEYSSMINQHRSIVIIAISSNDFMMIDRQKRVTISCDLVTHPQGESHVPLYSTVPSSIKGAVGNSSPMSPSIVASIEAGGSAMMR